MRKAIQRKTYLKNTRFLQKNFPWVYGKCNLNILGYGEKKIDNNENDSK